MVITKKRLITATFLVFCIFLTSFLVLALTQKIIIDIPGSYIMNGKNISVLGISKDAVNVDVDGVLDRVEKDRTKTINGMIVHVIGYSSAPAKAILNLTVNIICGNGKCEEGESNLICCTDCGCFSAKETCIGNRCVENITNIKAKHECYTDADCRENDSCSASVCYTKEYPNKCINKEITACTSGDNCCPKECDTPEDKDCATVDKCKTDKDCDDGDLCTSETCEGTPKRCNYKKQQGCTLENQCFPDGSINNGQFCLASTGEWKAQKVEKAECAEDYECLSLKCSRKKCGAQKISIMPKIIVMLLILTVIIIVAYFLLIMKKED